MGTGIFNLEADSLVVSNDSKQTRCNVEGKEKLIPSSTDSLDVASSQMWLYEQLIHLIYNQL